MQPRDPSCPAPPPFFVRALIPIWRAIVRAYGKVSLGEVRAKHDTQARLKQAAEYVNLHYDVDALQRGFPARVQMLLACEGGRIGK